MTTEPFEVLGLHRGASLDEVRAARRRLARHAHPDVGGAVVDMQRINAAFDAAVAHITGRRPLPTTASPAPSAGRRVAVDAPSFTIDALPAEAFEALLVVTSWIGEVLVDDPPYLLEVMLHEPSPCWCRLDLVPEAGSSTVSIVVAGIGDHVGPDVEVIRDLWVAQLNRLGELPS